MGAELHKLISQERSKAIAKMTSMSMLLLMITPSTCIFFFCSVRFVTRHNLKSSQVLFHQCGQLLLNFCVQTAAVKWGLFIKMATGCESQRWGTLADRGRAGVTEMSGSTVSAASAPVLALSMNYLLLSKTVPVIPRYGHQMCSVFLWKTWLEKQAETAKGYFSSELGMSRSITDHRSRSRVLAWFLYMHCEPQEQFFCCCCCVSRSTFHEFLFFFFFSPV